MSEIIKFPGSYKGPEEDQPESVPSIEISEDTRINEIHFTEMLHQMRTLWPQISNKIELIRDQRRLIENYSDEEIAGWINKSTDNDWKNKPVFFNCLIQEARRRGLERFGLLIK